MTWIYPYRLIISSWNWSRFFFVVCSLGHKNLRISGIMYRIPSKFQNSKILRQMTVFCFSERPNRSIPAATQNFVFFICQCSLSHDLYACATVLLNSIQSYVKCMFSCKGICWWLAVLLFLVTWLVMFVVINWLNQTESSLYENSQETMLYMLVKFHELWSFLAIPDSGLNIGVD